MSMLSDALTVECDIRHAAFDRETIRCTLTIVLLSELHLMSMSSDALTVVSMSDMLHLISKQSDER